MSIDHDLTSAFVSMGLQIETLQKKMPALLQAYHYALEKGFDPSALQPRHAELIGKIGDNLNDSLDRIKASVNDLRTK